MCVVAIVENARPSEEQVDKMWATNPNGGGVAWREGGLVHWDKGLSLEEMQEYNRNLPLPYILHFRVPSNNTSTLSFACHPFPVAADVSPKLKGTIDGFVLFHNGHWNDWRKKLEDFSCRGGWKLPSGPWSDTRALAWTAFHMGPGMLELIDEKVVIFGPHEDDLEIFGTWQRCPADEDPTKHMLVTNRVWETKFTADNRCPAHYQSQGSTGSGVHLLPGATGGSSQPSQFRHKAASSDRSAGRGDTEQEAVQEADAKAGGSRGSATGTKEVKEEAKVTRPFAQLIGDVTQPDMVGIPSSRCQVCGGTKAGVEEDSIRFCWHCWSSYRKQMEIGDKLCEHCFKNNAQRSIVGDDRKICGECWHNQGCPKLVNVEGAAI